MNQELDEMKRINLVEYAASQGYSLDKSRSTRSSKVMTHANGDKVVISTSAETGHSIYFSIRDDHDNGTIIDFIQRRSGKNLGYVRQELRAWIGKNNNLLSPIAQKYMLSKPVPSNKDLQTMAFKYAQTEVVRNEHSYLESRGINSELLSDLRFKGKIRSDAQANAIFPHFDHEGVCGYEIKGKRFSGFAKGGEKGLWFSNFNGNDKRLLITESAIDALSYHRLHNEEKTRYVSIGGSMSDKQKGLLKGTIKKIHDQDGYVVYAFDNDEQGKKYIKLVADLMNSEQIKKAERGLPEKEGYDWNDILKEQIKVQY